MNLAILHKDIQDFINANLDVDTTRLLLKGTSFKDVSTQEIVAQIEAKKRCRKKLQTWFNTKNIYYPNKLNIEQTSSEITAQYKSQIVSGNSLIDITGGFGVDCYYFSKTFNEVTHCEINSLLSSVVQHNYKELNVTNINCIADDGLEYLSNTKNLYDCIYIDPSRRHDKKGKVFFLSDCLPNVPEHLKTLFEYSSTIIIKTSPLLDITAGINELQNVSEIHVVAVNNEVKELLWVLKSNVDSKTKVSTINFRKNEQQLFSFSLINEKITRADYSAPQQYLYEPNSALLKSGAFKTVGKAYGLFKLHPHTHLYTNNKLITFPGRRFKIDKVLPFNKKRLKYERISKVNIATRNFPESVAIIKKKFKLQDGSETYLFFTTNHLDEKIVLFCSKVA